MTSAIRVVTTITNDIYVRDASQDSGSLQLAGLCVDLWRKTAKDLNVTFDMRVTGTWKEMVESLKANDTDVLMQRVDVESTRNRGWNDSE